MYMSEEKLEGRGKGGCVEVIKGLFEGENEVKK